MPVGLVDYIICRMFSISGASEIMEEKKNLCLHSSTDTTQRWEITAIWQKGIYVNREKPDSQGWSHDTKKNIFYERNAFRSFC